MEPCRTPSHISTLTSTLTVRQVQMMDMVCEGKLYKQIAAELAMKDRFRVACSMEWIKKKLRARTLAHAVAIYCGLKEAYYNPRRCQEGNPLAR